MEDCWKCKLQVGVWGPGDWMSARLGAYIESNDVLFACVRSGHLDCILYCLCPTVGKRELRQALRHDVEQSVQ